MPVDIVDFRTPEGIEKLKQSQTARNKSTEIVDEIAALDAKWRQCVHDNDIKRKEMGQIQKKITEFYKQKKPDEAAPLKAELATRKAEEKESVLVEQKIMTEIQRKLPLVGNYVHESVPIGVKEEDCNEEMKEWRFGEFNQTGNELHHHELLHMIGGYDGERGIKVAGHRGYFLTGVGVLLNQALINYGITFLMSRGYNPIQPPYYMKKEVMAETAQLEQFDEELYKVVGHEEDNGEKKDMYLIATSEQPISALHRQEWLKPADLPYRYAGSSTCFRKEAGSHGKDCWGIFRVHQFEKIEQFTICSPETSWEEHEKMMEAAMDFYKSLGLPFHVVKICSAALNNAAAKKYDLEAWFPALGEMRELVSASNCTDYQSRAMGTRFGQKKMGDREKKFVHMLNATLCATERTMCCILENYQCEEGVRVPEVLRPFMGGMEILPFINEKPENKNKAKSEAGQKAGGKKNKKKNKNKNKNKNAPAEAAEQKDQNDQKAQPETTTDA